MTTNNIWQTVKLGKKAHEVRELYEPKPDETLSYIGLEHIEQETLQISGIGSSASTVSTKKIFRKGDILFGSLRAYFRKVVRPRFNGVCSTDITVIRANSDTNQIYLHYFIASPVFISHATNISSGTRMPRANWNVLAETEWVFPPLPIQRKIASILSVYDDLIENNLRRIKILEEMAKTIYEEWFVKFRFPGHESVNMAESELGLIPEGWEVGNFEKYLHIFNGYAFKSSEYTTHGIPLVRTKDFTSSSYIEIGDKIFISDDSLEGYARFLLLEYDFLLVMVGASIGKYGMVFKKDLPSLQNQNMWAIRAKNNSLSKQFVLLMMPALITKVLGHATGAAREFFRKEHLYNQNILIPEASKVETFTSLVDPIIQNIGAILHKNSVLRSTRDFLLPKLISGEIDVENLDIQTGGLDEPDI